MSLFTPQIKSLRAICLASLVLTPFTIFAGDYTPAQTKKIIDKLYHTLDNNPKSDMAARLDYFSSQFLGKPYLLGALGEGANARFDQSPLYRTDAFDCETYVDTVVALALANNQRDFAQCINKIRYANGKVNFTSRNHFTALDWNQNNQQQNFTKDITASITNQNKQPVLKMAAALVNKPAWYKHLGIERIQLFPANKKEQADRLPELQKQGQNLEVREEKIPYLPLNVLFDEKGKPNEHLFSQIPDASIIEIVRPNWNLEKTIGTNMNVSHLGFAFWIKGKLMFREASSTEGEVVTISLTDYLAGLRQSPTIKGINVQVIVPKSPLGSGCTVQGS